MEKFILLILLSILTLPAWAKQFSLGGPSELILEQNGILKSLPELLPAGAVVEVEENILSSVTNQGRRFQQRYTNQQGVTGLSSSPLIPRIKFISLPDGYPYSVEQLNSRNFFLPLSSLNLEPTEAIDPEQERLENFLGITPHQSVRESSEPSSEIQSSTGNEDSTIEPEISQPLVEVMQAADNISDSARAKLYPPICGCTDCDLMTAHKEDNCDALSSAAGSCIQGDEHDGNDWLAPANLPVHAPCDGDVVFYDATDRFGRQLILHCNIEGADYHFRFNHVTAASSAIKDNKKVKAGQLLVTVGNTGTDQGYHLSHQIHQVRDPKLVNDRNNTYKSPEQDPNVIQSVDPSLFYAQMPSSEVTPETREEYRKKILALDCPELPNRTDDSQAPISSPQGAVN